MEERDAQRTGGGDPGPGDQLGEGLAGIGGTVAGAALGSAAGPIGALVGGIAGAVGGWWAGRSVSQATAEYTPDDDRYYRAHWDADVSRPAGIDFEQARTGYVAGHLAGTNPDYRELAWRDVARDIRAGWRDDLHGPWDLLQERVRHGWEHVRNREQLAGEDAGA